MFGVQRRHLQCLANLLTAAAAPSSASTEAVYTLYFSLQQAGHVVDATSCHAVRLSHSSTTAETADDAAGQQKNNPPPNYASAYESLKLASAVASQQKQAPAAQPAPDAVDAVELVSMLHASRSARQHKTAISELLRGSPGTIPLVSSSGRKRPARQQQKQSKPVDGRLSGLKQLVQRESRTQQLTADLQKLQQQGQQQLQQEQQPQADQDATGHSQGAASHTASQHSEHSREHFKRRTAALRQGLAAFRAGGKLAHKQPGQPPPPSQQPQQQQQQQQEQLQQLHKPKAPKRLHQQPSGLDSPQAQQQQQQQQQQLQQQFRQPLQQQQGHSGLPMMLQLLLLQDQAAYDAAAAPQAATHSALCSSSSSRALYNNWTDLDTESVITDTYDTFLGVWPSQAHLPPLAALDGPGDEDPEGPGQEGWPPNTVASTAVADGAAGHFRQEQGQQLTAPVAAAGTAAGATGGGLAASRAADADADAGSAGVASGGGAPSGGLQCPAMPWATASAEAVSSQGTSPACLTYLQEDADRDALLHTPEEGAMDVDWAAEMSSSSSSSSSTAPVDSMSSTEDAAAVEEALEEHWQLGRDSWLVEACNRSLLLTAQAAGTDSAAAAQAASAALQTSDAVAADAAAALPHLQYPAKMPLLLAMQYTMQQLQQRSGRWDDLWQPAADSSGSSEVSAGGCVSAQGPAPAAAPTDPAAEAFARLVLLLPAAVQEAHPALAVFSHGDSSSCDQPYAWMYAPAETAAAAGGSRTTSSSGTTSSSTTTTSSKARGLQYVLQDLSTKEPGAERFEFQPSPAPTPPAWFPVEPSLLQYVPAAACFAGRQQANKFPAKEQGLQQHQQEQQQQQQQQQVDQWEQQDRKAQQTPVSSLQFLGDLWQAAKESWGLADKQATGSPTSDSPDPFASNSDPEGLPQAQQQQQQQAAVAAAADGTAAVHHEGAIEGRGFLLLPPTPQLRVQQDHVVLARVAAMSVGTSLEPLLWSVMSQQPTQMQPGRQGLTQVRGAVTRHTFGPAEQLPSVTCMDTAQQQAAAAAQEAACWRAQKAQQQPRFEAVRDAPGWPLQRAAMTASADAFGAVAAAAFAVVRRAQRVLQPSGKAATTLAAGEPLLPAVAAAATSSPTTSSTAAAAVGPVDYAGGSAGTAAATPAVQWSSQSHGLWDDSQGCWQGVWLSRRQHPLQQNLPEPLHSSYWGLQPLFELEPELKPLLQLLQPSKWQVPLLMPQYDKLAAGCMTPGAAADAVLEHIREADSSMGLQELLQQYPQYISVYTQLSAAILQQAQQVWAAEAALLRVADASAAADPAAGSSADVADTCAQPRNPLALASATEPTGGSGRAIDLMARMSASTLLTDGPTPAAAASAAAGRSQDPRSATGADTQLRLQAMVAQHSSVAAAADIFKQLTAWLTAVRRKPYDLMTTAGAVCGGSGTRTRKAATDSDGSSLSPALHAGYVQQLLTLGMTHQGTLLPASTHLLPLLHKLQQPRTMQQLPESAVEQTCKQLLSPGTGLQRWRQEEQRAAFAVLQSGVQQLQPLALMQVLQLLAKHKHLRHLSGKLQQEPALLYSAAVARLAQQAAAADQQRDPQLLAQFTAAGPELLLWARQACLSAAAMVYRAQKAGQVLPADTHLRSDAVSARYAFWPASLAKWSVGRHMAYIERVEQWEQQLAATPAVSDQVIKAAASGQLQQVAAVLRHALAAPTVQQPALDPYEVADLLQLLALSWPVLQYRSQQDAEAVAAVMRGDERGLMAGAEAIKKLPAAVSRWLGTPQRCGVPLLQLQLQPPVVLQTVAAALQLRLDGVQQWLKMLGQNPAAAAATAAATDGAAAKHTGTSSSGSQYVSPALQQWSLRHLQLLLEVMVWRKWTGMQQAKRESQDLDRSAAGGAVFVMQQGIWDDLAPAATLRVREAAADLSRHAAAPTLVSPAAKQGLREALFLSSRVAHLYTVNQQYQPVLLDALQELLVAAEAWQQKTAKRRAGAARLLQPGSFTRLICTLATFDTCSPPAAAAIRQLAGSVLRSSHSNQSVLARLASALAVLNEADPGLWRLVKAAVPAKLGLQGGHMGVASAATVVDQPSDGSDDDTDAVESGDNHHLQLTEQAMLFQLLQAHVYVQHVVPAVAPLLPSDLVAQALAATRDQSQAVFVSQMQRDVGHLLGRLQASGNSPVSKYQQEHKTILGSTDIIVDVVGAAQPVAIEVDGPFHYAKNRMSKRLGSTVLRDRLLAINGFKVLALPYWEWEKHRDSAPDKAAAWLESQVVAAAQGSAAVLPPSAPAPDSSGGIGSGSGGKSGSGGGGSGGGGNSGSAEHSQGSTGKRSSRSKRRRRVAA